MVDPGVEPHADASTLGCGQGNTLYVANGHEQKRDSTAMPCRFKEMREANQPMAEVALNLYRECLRKVLMQRGGYECQETEGSFMLSFYNCIDAVQFCILVRPLLVSIVSME